MADADQDIAELESTVILLEQQITDAQNAIADKQNLIWESCPSGYAISQINSDGSVECELASGGFTSFSVSSSYAPGNAGDATAFVFTSVTATCPSGSKRTGGGFAVGNDLTFVGSSCPDGSNSWFTSVRGTWPVTTEYRSYINCISFQ